MAYKVLMFDGLPTPEYKVSGNEDNIGTGLALSPLVRLPGGGFYDTRGERRALAGLQPVTRSCVLWGDTQATLRANLEALRLKVGERGRLSVRFDDGELRWQWARLLEMNIPRPLDAVSKFLPLELSWQPVNQFWYGAEADDWTWGDGSWVFGDGTAEFGSELKTIEIDAASTTDSVTVDGNSPARDVVLTVTTNGDDYGSLRFSNLTNGSEVLVSNLDTTVSEVIIDCGAKSARKTTTTSYTISSIAQSGTQLSVVTSASHGLSVGDIIRIAGTTNYNGEYEIYSIPTATSVTAYIWTYISGATETSGTLTEMVGIRSTTTVYDQQHWFWLSPGANSVNIFSDNVPSGLGSLTIAYTEHYA